MNLLPHYTGQRKFYPFVFGGVFWVLWFVSSLAGNGVYDLAGHVVGTDYMMGYTSGQALSEGKSDELFDYAAQQQRQIEIVGQDEGASFSLNLPILQWIYVPFAQLPYLWSVVAWSAFGMGLLALSLKMLGRLSVLPLALTFVPVFSNFTFGQNAFVSLFLLTSVYVLWSRDRRFLAGIVLALLLYKPQLVTGIGLLWLLNGRRDWPALAGFSVGAAGVAAFMLGVMPTATSDYFDFLRNGAFELADADEFPVYLMNNPRGFFENLIPVIADPLWILTALAGIAIFVKMWRSRSEPTQDLNRPFWFAAAMVLTMWATPHALNYDWTLLLIPAILFWHARPDWHDELANLYIWGWIAYLVTLPLILAQQAVLPISIQVSVVFFAAAGYTITRLFFQAPVAAAPEPMLSTAS